MAACLLTSGSAYALLLSAFMIQVFFVCQYRGGGCQAISSKICSRSWLAPGAVDFYALSHACVPHMSPMPVACNRPTILGSPGAAVNRL